MLVMAYDWTNCDKFIAFLGLISKERLMYGTLWPGSINKDYPENGTTGTGSQIYGLIVDEISKFT